MTDPLRSKLIRLAHANPELRPHLLPILTADSTRPLHEIADEIRRDWKNVNFAAKPYLEAMSGLDKITDNYGADSGKGIVAYFLNNASSWKGEVAKRVKTELKKMSK